MTDKRTVLFLQGPISPFFSRIADRLEAAGSRAIRVNISPGDALIWRRPGGIPFRGRLEAWPRFIGDLIEREQVTDLVLLGEQRDYHRIAIEKARAFGANVIATDFGYIRPDWTTFELDGMTGASRFPKSPAAIRELARRSPSVTLEPPAFRDKFWQMAARDIVYNVTNSLFWFLYPHYRTHQVDHPILTYAGTGWRLLNADRRQQEAAREAEEAEKRSADTFLFPLQIARDYSIRAYSKYRDLQTPIREIIQSFAKHAADDATLIVKIHPLDPGLTNWRRIVGAVAAANGVENRVRFIDGGDLARLIVASKGVVLINSTVGIVSLQKGVPTLALGQAIYDVQGMTADCGLDAFWRAPPPPDMALVEDFVRALAGAHMIRGTFYSEPGLSAGVEAATRKLLDGAVNQPMPAG